jgi:Flp pilus assembly pilin Flp
MARSFLKKFSKDVLKNNKGQGMVEYILLMVVIVALVTIFKDPITRVVKDKVGSLSDSISGFTGGN